MWNISLLCILIIMHSILVMKWGSGTYHTFSSWWCCLGPLWTLRLERFGLFYFVSSTIFQLSFSVFCMHSRVPIALFIMMLFRCPWLKLVSPCSLPVFRVTLAVRIVYPSEVDRTSYHTMAFCAEIYTLLNQVMKK